MNNDINETLKQANETQQKIFKLFEDLIEENRKLKENSNVKKCEELQKKLDRYTTWRPWPTLEEDGSGNIFVLCENSQHDSKAYLLSVLNNKILGAEKIEEGYIPKAYCGPFRCP